MQIAFKKHVENEKTRKKGLIDGKFHMDSTPITMNVRIRLPNHLMLKNMSAFRLKVCSWCARIVPMPILPAIHTTVLAQKNVGTTNSCL